MTSDRALKVKLYPTGHQVRLLERTMRFRQLYYIALCQWWNSTRDACAARYAAFCETTEDEEARKAFSKTLPWPPKPFPVKTAKGDTKDRGVSKMDFNDTGTKVIYDDVSNRMKFAVTRNYIYKAKGVTKNAGDVFRINALYLPVKYGDLHTSGSIAPWVKDDFARALNRTFSTANQNERLKRGKPLADHVKVPRVTDACTFKVSLPKDLAYTRASTGRVNRIQIPFLDDNSRKSCRSDEWIDCRLSDKQFARMLKATAITVRKVGAEWWASISCSMTEETRQATGMECGIDLGLTTSATLAFAPEGEATADHDTFEELNIPSNEIKRLNAHVDYLRKQQSRRIKTWLRKGHADGTIDANVTMDAKGRLNATARYVRDGHASSSYRKTELRIAQISKHIADIRDNFCKQSASYIAKRCDAVGMEDLSVKGMMQNHHLARSIANVGFYMFRTAVENKLSKDNVKPVDRFAPSTQTCSYCHHRMTGKSKIRLGVHEWTCPQCGHHHGRDENAASNLRPSMQSYLSGLGRSSEPSSEVTGGECKVKRRRKSSAMRSKLPKGKETRPCETSRSEQPALAVTAWDDVTRWADAKQKSLFFG